MISPGRTAFSRSPRRDPPLLQVAQKMSSDPLVDRHLSGVQFLDHHRVVSTQARCSPAREAHPGNQPHVSFLRSDGSFRNPLISSVRWFQVC